MEMASNQNCMYNCQCMNIELATTITTHKTCSKRESNDESFTGQYISYTIRHTSYKL